MVLDIKDVSLVREGNWILKNINWTINKGEHWVLLGLNGAGKTALLHMLYAFYFPTKGMVKVLDRQFGKDILGEELRQKIGLVSSTLQGRFYESDSAYHVVLSGGFASIGLYDTPTDSMREKAQKLLKEMGCFPYANRSYRTLSQGERQRVMIARALMADPELLILDEPTNGLDFLAREGLLEVIQHVTASAYTPTVIYVTHHVEEILPIFTKTLLLKDGEVFSSGDTQALISEEVLSDFFGVPVEVIWHHGRPSLMKKHP
ncbi:ABC transporter ATP-binding protein [Aquibacillus salsiterrae]|uniref:ABC transporter ATP-binding protein n=1 Tax=Aquibacillus salsiterrae TaxID=2950439 RepID=A0A9X3WE85_9BACI|nr:ABC transporter ATP-binding protein [Aquibacillus salsiterrae]MDC3417108.1 ABC transporter ATP-binding protein [Aquibacillus salsiterrae]